MKASDRTTFETQISRRPGGKFEAVVTISRGENYWTSPLSVLEATSWEAARGEALTRVINLRKALT